MQIGSLIDTITSGALNFGTTNATTMTFGRAGQDMIINSRVGIGTSTPSATLHVNGSIFGNLLNVAADDLGLDTLTPGLLSIGSTTATSIKIGRGSVTTTIVDPLSAGMIAASSMTTGPLLAGATAVDSLKTVSVCSSTTTPATCGSSSAGSVALPTGISTLVVTTTAVTAASQIMITEDSSLGSRLGIICNTSTGRAYSVNARTPGVSFTIKSSSKPSGSNKACLSYWIVN
jgi:hypothetical protein